MDGYSGVASRLLRSDWLECCQELTFCICYCNFAIVYEHANTHTIVCPILFNNFVLLIWCTFIYTYIGWYVLACSARGLYTQYCFLFFFLINFSSGGKELCKHRGRGTECTTGHLSVWASCTRCVFNPPNHKQQPRSPAQNHLYARGPLIKATATNIKWMEWICVHHSRQTLCFRNLNGKKCKWRWT